MNLIYSHNYATARAFAMREELMPGDWQWLRDAGVIRQYPRANVFKVPRWEANPRREQIDLALQRAAESHRLGTLTDVGEGSSTLGISGA
ncbi:hypothetical protein [Marilutibacter alkalisoli]|uniref:Uncharacterized protein n=1 Tax=Marilutibacter alkalisoli TaxID=2591633 RepID=A0A514BNK2_9GAMM|nr:hypothetical protein [Lysobacter alkalisoli]QDH68961.1 hypothetical protein FKV23_01715 [Lysobacter alkalisoli]